MFTDTMKIVARYAVPLLLVFLIGLPVCVKAQEQTPEKALEEPVTKPEETEEAKPKKRWSFKVSGELTNYFVSESSPFFGDNARHWLETSLRLDGTVTYKNFTAGISGLGIKTTGLDSFGTGTMPAGAPAGTNRPSALPSFYLDQAYIQLDRIGGLPLKATLGRQHITIGSQFLIGDGVRLALLTNGLQKERVTLMRKKYSSLPGWHCSASRLAGNSDQSGV